MSISTLRQLTVLLGSVCATTAGAHHSFTATYDENRQIVIEGTLVQFLFRNPHSFVHVLAPDDTGQMQRWAVEWGGAGVLGRQGLSRESLSVGDHVVISGNPGRSAIDRRLRMQTLQRPADHFAWGNRPDDTFE